MATSAYTRILSAVLFGGVSLSTLAPFALAQEDDAVSNETVSAGLEPNEVDSEARLGTVLVTARRVEEDLQSVPVAITALSEDDLVGQGVVSMTDLQFVAPSVQMTTSFGRLNGGFAVRGLAGGTQAYFAEIPGGPTEAASAFYDVGSVQVLNGPQGTLFGRANTAGAVLISPNRPDLEKFSGSAKAAAGNLGLSRFTGVVNVPVVSGELGVRLAVNSDHLDGYVKSLRNDDRYSENNSWGARLSVDWQPLGGRVTNYSVLDYYKVDQASTAFALAGVNTTLPLYNLPDSITATDGLSIGTARFGSACTAAFNAGIVGNVNQCIDDRLRLAATFKPAAEAENARIRSSDDAWRYNPGSLDLALDETLEKWTVVNQTQFDFGQLGFTDVQFRNIFGYQAARGGTAWNVDGLGGLIQSSLSVTQTSSYAFSVTAQQDGNSPLLLEGPWQEIYSNESQLRGSAWEGLLDWSIGGYYQLNPGVRNLEGIRNLSRVWSGTTLPTGGYNPSFPFSDGGETTQRAIYGQATADISAVAPFLTSLKLTGGLRKSWDKSELFSRPVTTDIVTGRYIPGTTRNRQFTKSDGENSTLSLEARVTSDLLVYAAARKGYRPGGINSVRDASGLPNFSANYAPETVEDIEFGVKHDFSLGGVAGRLNGALYQTKYGDIQRTFNASVNGVTTTYIVNASAAEIRGLELQGQLQRGDWLLSGTFAYTDAEFTDWIGADPLGQIRPGDSQCLPQSTSAICLIDLSNNEFPNIPEHQGSLSLQYTMPVDANFGEVVAQVSAYAQSRRYFNDATTRHVEVFGEGVRDAISQPSYNRFNARAEWRNVMASDVSLAAFVNNIADEGYATGAIAQLHSLGTAVKSYAEPRVFGFEVRYDF